MYLSKPYKQINTESTMTKKLLLADESSLFIGLCLKFSDSPNRYKAALLLYTLFTVFVCLILFLPVAFLLIYLRLVWLAITGHLMLFGKRW